MLLKVCFPIFPTQLNYEFLRQCVASGPVTPMPPEAWGRIVAKVPGWLLSSPLTSPLVPHLHAEVRTKYEDTIRKNTS